jgi:hypothetical protein
MGTTLVAASLLLAQYGGTFGSSQFGSPVMQGELSAGMTDRWDSNRVEGVRNDAPQGSLYLGVAMPMGFRTSDGLFFGFGGEATADGEFGSYSWSLGGGPRVGYMWRSGPGLADGYVYLRGTPFYGMKTVADEAYLDDVDDPDISRSGFGFRIGVGATSLKWTRTVWGGLGSSSWDSIPRINANSGDEAALCLVGILAILLVNHVELTYEWYAQEGMPREQRVGIRFGIGF